MMEDLKNIIESLLFVANEPLTVDRIKKALPDAEAGDIRDALRTLHEEYFIRGGGFYLSEVAGGYQFRTRSDYNKFIRRMIRPNAPRLSKPALETLAIVAYKQPVIRSDIEHIRGVDCGGILRTLLERKLVRILGRKEIPGRPLIYATTKMFLEVFDLKDLKDLPSPKEIEEMSETLPELEALLPLDEDAGSTMPDGTEAAEEDTTADSGGPEPASDGGPAEESTAGPPGAEPASDPDTGDTTQDISEPGDPSPDPDEVEGKKA